jgi:NAD-dependent deacetylase
MDEIPLDEVISWIKTSKYATVFSGAGISTESGVPDFRGPGGLWETYNPDVFSLSYFKSHPKEAWKSLKEIQQKSFGSAKPNKAHLVIAKLEKLKYIKAIITQNIDNLHQKAGSKNVVEFHGNSQKLVCLNCLRKTSYNRSVFWKSKLPKCNKCGGLLKPDFVFFEEPIPSQARRSSHILAQMSDLFILVGTSGAVMPAAGIPFLAKQNGAKIIEINIAPSDFTNKITDIFIKGKAGVVFSKIAELMKIKI